MRKNFFLELARKITKSAESYHRDNFDFTRYDEEQADNEGLIKAQLKQLAGRFGFYKNGHLLERYFETIDQNYSDYEGYEYLFNALETDESRDLLVTVVAYRLMGYRKIKLPLNTVDFTDRFEKVKALRTKSFDYHSLNNVLKLYEHDLATLGYPLKMILSSYGIMIDFVHEQYRYSDESITIRAESGDYVIDGGGCYGDTALYFSLLAGEGGKVYSFEFVPSNLEVFRRNIALNPGYATNILIEEKPLGGGSDQAIYYIDRGPASRVSEEKADGYNGVTHTITIDDFVTRNNVPRIDFIKLDIEGSEFPTLKGAAVTIKKFKPKLAIALYHSPGDFERIPRLIKELEPSYKFYLKHATINNEETMLFASI